MMEIQMTVIDLRDKFAVETPEAMAKRHHFEQLERDISGTKGVVAAIQDYRIPDMVRKWNSSLRTVMVAGALSLAMGAGVYQKVSAPDENDRDYGLAAMFAVLAAGAGVVTVSQGRKAFKASAEIENLQEDLHVAENVIFGKDLEILALKYNQ